MIKIVIINMFVFIFLGTFQMFNALSAHQNDGAENLKIKRSSGDPLRDMMLSMGETTSDDLCEVYTIDTSNSNQEKMSERYPSPGSEATETSETETFTSELLKKCFYFALGPGCYEKRLDGTVFVSQMQRVLPRSDYLIIEDILYICPQTPKRSPKHIGIVSIISMSILAVCVATFILYFTIKSPKNLTGCCLFSLYIALLIGYIQFFVEGAVENRSRCRILGMFMSYFFLAGFFWMNVFSYNVWRSVRLVTTRVSLEAGKPMKIQLAIYSAYAWGSPLLISIVSIIIHNSTSNEDFQLIFSVQSCFYARNQALVLYFFGPLFALLGINTLLTVSSYHMMYATQNPDDKDILNLKARIHLSLRLCCSVGLTWIFGAAASFTYIRLMERLWALFAMWNVLESVFILRRFTIREGNGKKCKKVSQSPKSTVAQTLSSSSLETIV